MAEEFGKGAESPLTIAIGASALAHHRILHTLVTAELMSQQQAASTMVEIANDIRNLTEDGGGEALGEVLAGRYEVMASWLLGKPQSL